MARQNINLGTPPSGVGGDVPRSANVKINAMMREIYNWLANKSDPESQATELPAALPVAKGGTGATNQADAKTSLGLGTAASATIGTAPGQVPVVGNFGLGDASVNNPNWNNNLRTGFSSYVGSAPGGPSFNGGNWFANGIDIVYGADPSVKTQFAMKLNSADFAMRSINMNLANASPWVYFYNTGNTTRAADGTLKAI